LNHSNIGSWIVQSGASDYIYASLKFFDSYKLITPIHINLPNGHMAITKCNMYIQTRESKM